MSLNRIFTKAAQKVSVVIKSISQYMCIWVARILLIAQINFYWITLKMEMTTKMMQNKNEDEKMKTTSKL